MAGADAAATQSDRHAVACDSGDDPPTKVNLSIDELADSLRQVQVLGNLFSSSKNG